MENTFRVKLASGAGEWAGVLERASLQLIIDRLTTKRTWQLEDFVEAGEAGWVAGAREGKTSYALSMTVSAEAAKASPRDVIEWTLVAGVSREDSKLRVPLAAIMFGTGLIFAAAAIHFGLPVLWTAILALLGIMPVGLVLAIVALRPVATRRGLAPVPGGAEFFKEVANAVEQVQGKS